MLEGLMIFVGIVIAFLLIRKREKGCSSPMQPSSQSSYESNSISEGSRKEEIYNFLRVSVVCVVDGDTVIVSRGWSQITVRLDSIDCPEDGQYWGDTAKYGLIKLIGGKKVHIEAHGQDVHGRTLATVYVWHGRKNEWLNVNERMVTLGHAWVMRKYYDHLPQDRKDKLNQLERWAKSKKVGLWCESNPTPPWEWRKENSR